MLRLSTEERKQIAYFLLKYLRGGPHFDSYEGERLTEIVHEWRLAGAVSHPSDRLAFTQLIEEAFLE